jgi:proline iminopeptidase
MAMAVLSLLFVQPGAAALENVEFTIELNGLKLWCKVSGTGPVCLMPSPDWGPSSDYCFRTLKPMEKLFTVVYLNSRGRGRSQEPKSAMDHSWDDRIADLDALRIHLKQHKVWLIGHSEGGMHILQYACRHPNRVSEAVFCQPPLLLVG